MRMARLVCAVMAMALLAAACGGADAGVRTVLVDFSSDEFASFALANFPEKVSVRQGDTIRFRQTWTGEPHTSGLIDAEPYLEYTMRITEPGTYSYACLIHPPMVGEIEVT